MFIKENKTLLDKRFIFSDIHAAVFMSLKNHRTEFESRIPLVFKPGVAVHSRVVARFMLTVFSRIRQSAVFYLFRERSPIVSPIELSPFSCVRQHSQVGIKLRLHHVPIAALQHRPVYETLVLCRHRAAAPFAEIGSKRTFRVGINRIEGKERAVKLRWIFPIGITSEHIAEQLVVARHLSPFTFSYDIATLPEVVPPLRT